MHGDRRLKYPMKLVNGQWTRVSWDQAIDEIGDKLMEIRQKSGPKSVCCWAPQIHQRRRLSQSQACRLLGHQQFRPSGANCHSTTVAGVANTWGYGAMTNSYTDIRNTKTLLFLGGNPAEAHPVSLQHLLEGKELNRANFIVADPRLTRTAAHATEYVRLRPGTDIPVLWGLLWHIFKNGWEDKEFIEQRVYGMDDVARKSRSGLPRKSSVSAAYPARSSSAWPRCSPRTSPRRLIWAMGQTQHTMGTANVRASCILLLATGNVGKSGAGANIFRGHTNVQGATDLGLDVVTLPLYYGLAEGAWKHWCRVWEVDYDWMLSRFADKKMMEASGIPSTRWFDATLLPKEQVAQADNLKAMFVMGHGGNTVTRMPEAAKGIEKLDLLVVADPHPTTWAVLSERKNGTYLLPIATSYETNGSRTASNRAIQWGEQIVKPIFESKDDNEVMYLLAKKLGFADKMFKNIKVENNLPSPEDVLREINRGGWSTGYCGQSPERLKLHMANQKDFDMRTQKAMSGPAQGDYYGLPWPCWGTPEFKHPGTPLLYNTNLSIKEGGGTFRARFGIEREEKLPDGTTRKVSLLGNGYHSRDSEIKDGYPEFTYGVLKKLGWDSDLTPNEKTVIERVGGNNADAVSWSTDLSGGIQRVAWSTDASRTATPRRAATHGICPTPSRCAASRSIPRDPTSSRNIRPCPMPPRSACRISASRRRWRSTEASPTSSR